MAGDAAPDLADHRMRLAFAERSVLASSPGATQANPPAFSEAG